MKTPLSSVPVTTALIALSVLVFLLMKLDRTWTISSLLISQFHYPVLPEIQEGEIWRLITPAFLHFGIFHIVFNLIWTWEFGRLIESLQGSLTLITLFLVSSIVVHLAQYLVDGPAFGGMSGAIYVFFGYVWFQCLTNPRFEIRLNPTVVYFLLGWLVVCWTGMFETLFGIRVANTAHTAGLVTGVVFSLLVTAMQRRHR